MRPARSLVLGSGNAAPRDDAVGLRVARELSEHLRNDRRDVHVAESCRGGVDLMERMVGCDRAIVVDAIRTGADPGTLHRLGPASIPTQHSASGHDANLPTALALGHRVGAHLPADEDTTIFGIEVIDTETPSEECTPPVAAAIPHAVAAIVAALDDERSLA